MDQTHNLGMSPDWNLSVLWDSAPPNEPPSQGYVALPFLKKILLVYFLERREGGEREKGRETSMCGCLSCAPPPEAWPAT